MLFVSQTASQDTLCESLRFAKEFVDLNKSQTALQIKICKGLCFANMRFFLPIVLWGQYSCRNDNGPGAWQGASF
jgi:hypothetical protein